MLEAITRFCAISGEFFDTPPNLHVITYASTQHCDWIQWILVGWMHWVVRRPTLPPSDPTIEHFDRTLVSYTFFCAG